MQGKTARTTLAIPVELLEAMDKAVGEGMFESRSAMIASAIRHELAALEREAIDASFAGMATDVEYQEQALSLVAEFRSIDSETDRIWAGS